MARIVLGIGTSHSPLLALGPRMWAERGRDDLRRAQLHLTDGRVVDYPALAAETAGRVGVTLLVPGGMHTAFFDGRPEQVVAECEAYRRRALGST